MTLIDALKDGHQVLLTFVDVRRDAQWSMTFTSPSDLARFLTPMVGNLLETREEDKTPFKYYKVIFVSENPPKKEEEEDIWENSNEEPGIQA